MSVAHLRFVKSRVRSDTWPSLGWLLGKGDALTDLSGVQVTARWSGRRLSGLEVGRAADGSWRLSGLGSKGFLLGPLLARHVAGDVLGNWRL